MTDELFALADRISKMAGSQCPHGVSSYLNEALVAVVQAAKVAAYHDAKKDYDERNLGC